MDTHSTVVVIEEWANGREKRDSVVVGYCVEKTNKRGLSPIRSDFGVTEQGQKMYSASVVTLCLGQYLTPPDLPASSSPNSITTSFTHGHGGRISNNNSFSGEYGGNSGSRDEIPRFYVTSRSLDRKSVM